MKVASVTARARIPTSFIILLARGLGFPSAFRHHFERLPCLRSVKALKIALCPPWSECWLADHDDDGYEDDHDTGFCDADDDGDEHCLQ